MTGCKIGLVEILSWNIMSGGFNSYDSLAKTPDRLDLLVSTVKSINADFVSLVDTHRWTEVFTLEDLKKLFDYPNVYAVKLEDERLKIKGHDNGVTVVSRMPHTRAETIRIATRNAIKVSTPEIDIFAVYLDDVSEDTRLDQVRVVLGSVDSNRPTIITGDFNTIDKDDLEEASKNLEELQLKFPGPMKAMEPSLNEMRRGEVTKVLIENGFVDLGKGRGNTIPAKLFPFPADRPLARFDYAFGNRFIKLEDFRVLTDDTYAVLSDHFPIWMRIEV